MKKKITQLQESHEKELQYQQTQLQNYIEIFTAEMNTIIDIILKELDEFSKQSKDDINQIKDILDGLKVELQKFDQVMEQQREQISGFFKFLIYLFHIISLDQKFVKTLEKAREHLIDQRWNLILDEYEKVESIDQKIDKIAEITLNNMVSNQNQRSIVWIDQNIQNKEFSKFSIVIQSTFPQIQHFHFLTSIEILLQILKKNIIVYLIIEGSIAAEIIKRLDCSPNIHSIILYSQKPQQYQSLKQQYSIIQSIDSQLESILQTLNDTINGTDELNGQVNFYRFPNYFKINNPIIFLRQEFSLKTLKQINFPQAYEIIQRCLQILPNLMVYFYNNEQIKLGQQIQKAFRTEKIEDILRLYTEEGDFYPFVNRCLQMLNENAILSAQLLIKSVKFCIQNYDDNQNDEMFFQPNFYLYRGIEYDVRKFMTLNKICDMIIFPAFTSTSKNFEKAKRFTKGQGIIFRIKFFKNNITGDFRKFRPKYIAQISKSQEEEEFVFSCFSCFIITDFGDNIIDLDFVSIDQ
ncbi:unnamed protein product [Paramecium octaurelia]|uniref:NAD(P)(+)--arginine ADP-ribosyltransferase n=1 Tax=Paramecium octaurelia TaxID=43137 RepID=A0A8S1XDC5_PAROT|nr:unnamed protein product [Paramecium octaurelia]